ncbi:hypothetical protein NE237_022777 [Protea cynaroides]|uniref:WAT1-related protein n=1 Tax=Protea cynaroides TaxID=273540 RepID=A0A9Q0K645_9MAGN|nr:hypothetical protein NE237_022777 [Protea cynaroides]
MALDHLRLEANELSPYTRSCAKPQSLGSKPSPPTALACGIAKALCYIVLLHSYISTGASASVLVFYQHIIATSLLFSLAFLFERKRRPPLTLQTISWAFLLGLLQIPLGKLLLTWSLRFISATCQSIAMNAKTALVFVLAVAFGRERFSFLTINGQAKLWGITLSAVGTTIMIVWRGSTAAMQLPEGTFQDQLIGWIMTGSSLLSLAFANLLMVRRFLTSNKSLRIMGYLHF